MIRRMDTPRRLVSSLVISMVWAAPLGCDSSSQTACTAIGCTDGLAVTVTPTSAWPAGDYRFTIEADGVTTTCTGSLPLPACGTAAITCEGGEPDAVMIGESGCALAESEHAFSDIMFTATPASVAVTVEFGGTQIGAGSWSPEYQTSQPNGPECEPTCTNASVELALTFP
jgi:hypothetical protein